MLIYNESRKYVWGCTGFDGAYATLEAIRMGTALRGSTINLDDNNRLALAA